MSVRAVLRTASHLSFAGEASFMSMNDVDGIAIRPSERSAMFFWCPLEETDCLIVNKQMVGEKEAMKHVLRA